MNILKGIFGKKNKGESSGDNGTTPVAPAAPLPDHVRGHVALHVDAGFDSADEIADGTLEYFEGDDETPALDLAAVRKLTEEELARHEAEEASWSDPTDCDRIDAAFEALESKGIVARQNFTCCQNCGHGEIWDEIKGARKSRPVAGYTFFHMQDTDRAAAGGGLYLAYGATEPGDEAGVQVGKVIVSELQAAGLKTDWDGTMNKRIAIVGLAWKKRRNARR